MRLLRYHLIKIKENEWDFDNVFFNRINLLVGDSGTGKTRFLNTIINFFRQIVSEKIMFDGDWDIDLEINNIKYNYKLIISNKAQSIIDKVIEYELFKRLDNDEIIFERKGNLIIWQGNTLPKLSSEITCFSMLKNEDTISPIYNNLKNIIARRFSGSELNTNFELGVLNPDLARSIVSSKSNCKLATEVIDFHNKMDILKKIDNEGFLKVIDFIKTAFPFIIDANILNISQVLPNLHMQIQTPVFCIKERNLPNWIPCNDISSGMQKLFLLILDTYLLQDSGILLIDEYENSLGVNAINFLPDLINSISDNCQFIITSHHPYIVNNIPIESWRVFHRSGMNIHITTGESLKEKYSKSTQEYFIQLINDPLFSSGIE